MFLRNICSLQDPDGVTSQKTTSFIEFYSLYTAMLDTFKETRIVECAAAL
jgi:hypothetical protein